MLRDGRTLSAARIFGAFCVVALAGGCADSTINKPGASASTAGSAITIQTLPNPAALPQGSKNAEMAALIVRAYLNYRMTLGRELAREEARDRAERRRKSY